MSEKSRICPNCKCDVVPTLDAVAEFTGGELQGGVAHGYACPLCNKPMEPLAPKAKSKSSEGVSLPPEVPRPDGEKVPDILHQLADAKPLLSPPIHFGQEEMRSGPYDTDDAMPETISVSDLQAELREGKAVYAADLAPDDPRRKLDVGRKTACPKCKYPVWNICYPVGKACVYLEHEGLRPAWLLIPRLVWLQ